MGHPHIAEPNKCPRDSRWCACQPSFRVLLPLSAVLLICCTFLLLRHLQPTYEPAPAMLQPPPNLEDIPFDEAVAEAAAAAYNPCLGAAGARTCLQRMMAKAKSKGVSISYQVNWKELRAVSSPDAGSSLGSTSRTPEQEEQYWSRQKHWTLEHMMKCLTHPPAAGAPSRLSWESGTSESANLGAFRTLAGWWVHTRGPPDANTSSPRSPVTVVTSGSMDRLSQLRAMCRSWNGPLSATLIQQVLQHAPMPLNDTNQAVLHKAVLEVANLVSEMSLHPSACQLSVLLGYEVYQDEAALLLYPINNLRNYARLQARTPLVALLDIDMLPSTSLLPKVTTNRNAAQLLQQARRDKVAYILPAFELRGRFDTMLWADTLVSVNKRDMTSIALEGGMMRPFYYSRYNLGHNLTDFPRWLTSNWDYPVQHQQGCEPYVMGDRLRLPWFDSRYRGFGRNKVQHAENLHYEQWQFKVLHDVFLVHRPHRWTRAQQVYSQKLSVGENQTPLPRFLANLFLNQEQAMMSGQMWDAPLSAPLRHCLDVLPWWRGAVRRDRNSSLLEVAPFNRYVLRPQPPPAQNAEGGAAESGGAEGGAAPTGSSSTKPIGMWAGPDGAEVTPAPIPRWVLNDVQPGPALPAAQVVDSWGSSSGSTTTSSTATPANGEAETALVLGATSGTGLGMQAGPGSTSRGGTGGESATARSVLPAGAATSRGSTTVVLGANLPGRGTVTAITTFPGSAVTASSRAAGAPARTFPFRTASMGSVQPGGTAAAGRTFPYTNMRGPGSGGGAGGAGKTDPAPDGKASPGDTAQGGSSSSAAAAGSQKPGVPGVLRGADSMVVADGTPRYFTMHFMEQPRRPRRQRPRPQHHLQ